MIINVDLDLFEGENFIIKNTLISLFNSFIDIDKKLLPVKLYEKQSILELFDTIMSNIDCLLTYKGKDNYDSTLSSIEILSNLSSACNLESQFIDLRKRLVEYFNEDISLKYNINPLTLDNINKKHYLKYLHDL